VARLAFGNEDGVILGDLTWQSYVDTYDDGTITVDVYPHHNLMGDEDLPGFRYRVEYVGHAPNPGDDSPRVS